MLVEVAPAAGRRSRIAGTKTRTGPSGGFALALPPVIGGAGGRRGVVGGGVGGRMASPSDAAAGAGGHPEEVEFVQSSCWRGSSPPVPRSDEWCPFLYDIPHDLHPSYRPASPLIKVLILAGSGIVSAALTWGPRALLAAIFVALGSGNVGGDGSGALISTAEHSLPAESASKGLVWTARKILRFLALFAATATASFIAAQDLLPSMRPSRIDTQSLLRDYWLPSQLSRYRKVNVRPLSLSLSAGEATGGGHSDERDEEEDGGKEEDDDDGVSTNLGVHYLRYDAQSVSTADETNDAGISGGPLPQRRQHRFDALHLNHGFGASSLSWLPALPSLVDRLDARVGLSHDAPGFGYTNRPHPRRQLEAYGSGGSASIGMELLDAALHEDTSKAHAKSEDEEGGTGVKESESVCLMGHSMGCVTTLLMARSLPEETRKFVVLVAPALTGTLPPSSNDGDADTAASTSTSVSATPSTPAIQSPPRRIRQTVRTALTKPLRTVLSILRIAILDPVGSYSLRRLVAGRNFWTKGLQLAWGDPSLVTESDALRFQWPSVGRGWEGGLLAFTRSRLKSGMNSYEGGDLALLRDVLLRPNTEVCVIYGTGDRVIPPSTVQGLLDKMEDACPPGRARIRSVEMEGVGHDPFEEDMEGFVEVVERLLAAADVEVGDEPD